jgi:hypothetical protein
MPEVNRYRVVLYGTSSERPNLKAKIELYAAGGGSGSSSAATVGRLRFHETGPVPPDAEEKGCVTMNLPASMLADVVDLLRNESPVYFAFHEGRGVLGTGVEAIGTRDEHVPQLVRLVEGQGPPVKTAALPVPAT